jgi:hypothetical protein
VRTTDITTTHFREREQGCVNKTPLDSYSSSICITAGQRDGVTAVSSLTAPARIALSPHRHVVSRRHGNAETQVVAPVQFEEISRSVPSRSGLPGLLHQNPAFASPAQRTRDA